MHGFSKLQAQEVYFSQFTQNLTDINPAFAGYDGCSSVSLHYRNEQVVMQGGYNTFKIAYDQNLSKLQSGVGISLAKDRQGGGAFDATFANFAYAFNFNLNRNFKMTAATNLAFYQNSFSPENLIFSNQINAQTGIISPSTENLSAEKYNSLDFGSGILLRSKKIFLSISANHIAKTAINSEKFFLPITYGLQAFYRVKFDPFDTKKTYYTFLPNLSYRQQKNAHFLQYGFYFIKKNSYFGGWFRQSFYPYFTNNALVFLVGMKFKKLEVAYSYDFTTIKTFGASFGNNEISIKYILNYKEKKGSNTIICPAYKL